MRVPAALLAALVAAAASPDAATADVAGRTDLRVRRLPVRLRMRPAGAIAAVTPTPAPRPTGTTIVAATADDGDGDQLTVDPAALAIGSTSDEAERPLADRVIFRLDVGFGVDGAGVRPGTAAARDPSYRQVRSYGVGDLYLGSRGLGAPWLSSYLASSLFLANARLPSLPATRDDEDNALMTQSAWVEVEEVSSRPWLRPIRVRAGRQWRYGTAIAHLDGVVVGWYGKALRVEAFTGTRTPDWQPIGTLGGAVSGLDARLELDPLLDIPAVLEAGTISYADHEHARVALAWRPSARWLARGSARILDGARARERAELRVRISDVTTVSVDVHHRSANDWRWDLAFVDAAAARDPGVGLDATDARPYLDLGPMRPRVGGNLRAGTVLLDNVDLLLRAGGAADLGGGAGDAFATTWGELGGAFEVRLRRTLALGVSALARAYVLDAALRTDRRDRPDALPASTAGTGDESMLEVGVTSRYSGGARRFNAGVEVYYRATRHAEVYQEPETATLSPSHGGGRITLDGWIRPDLRLRAEYDLSTELDEAPEIRGTKALRIVMEATF